MSNRIDNPSFELGNNDKWNWTGTTGYSWVGPNTDGDATKNGTYINGIWNSTIGDVECSQTINNLPAGNYKITALVTVSNNRTTNQRLFATANGVTKSTLYGASNHAAYKASNLAILGATETYSFGGYGESAAENGPFSKLSVVQQVTDGTLTIGVRVSGKSTTKGYDFSHTSKTDAGFFKFDGFTLTEVSNVATLDNISLNIGNLDAVFSPATTTYNAIIPEGTLTVKPTVVPSVDGVSVSGTGDVDVSSGSGTSVITVTALDGTTQKTYTINYKAVNLTPGVQQDKLYPDEFPLGDVTLLEGSFKHARDLNIQTLLKYDVNRLLAPYRKEAGLSAKAASFTNWDGLDGHVGGHYLTALSINYAATGDTVCKRLMDYMVAELKACQDANAVKNASWGVGYAGGVPNSASIWSTFKTGTFTAFNSAWVPWYNLHKTYAGLRDAWLYGGNETAKNVFLAFCDWGVNITSALSDAQMETILGTEHGGMNEIFADAYQMTGVSKYLVAAKRFSHKTLLNSMAAQVDNLNNVHANTQVPKAVGFQRIAEVSKEADYVKAGQFFWQTVTSNRTLASGGNSRKEYFPQASACSDYVNVPEGPESCNTNNMLKLTEDLFRVNPQAKYADFYERALYNHILSTQHPDHGGYVYFTPARPRHYRVYSAPNKAMWCCVGTGMENHGKYGEFIYTHHNDSLYLNLFVASELNWRDKGVKISQTTSFPEEEKTKLTVSVTNPTAFKLMVRSPKWVKAGALKIVVNTDTMAVQSVPQTYIAIDRTWNNGDSVKILLPMQNSVEQLPNVSSYIALMHGPILLGAKTGTEDLAGLVADESRWGHIANGTLLPLDKAPVIVGDKPALPAKIIPVAGKPLTFKGPGLFLNSSDTALVLEPFYKIHDSRYMMYWLNLSASQYQSYLDSLATVQKAALELELRTVDKVAPGEQQPEVDHKLQSLNSYTGTAQNEFWRDARNGGYVSYSMLTKGKSDLSLMVRYWGNESGSRSFDILVDGVKLTTENLVGKWNTNAFKNVEYPIPNSMTAGKDTVTVKFQGINSSNTVGGLFFVRLLMPLSAADVPDVRSNDCRWKVRVLNNDIVISGMQEPATVFVYDTCGHLLNCVGADSNKVRIPGRGKGIRIVRVVSGEIVQVNKLIVE
ncbi:MAG TPA: beta-L-arabinofuranosidase domain-containing protein [Paludibacter sp.]|nr:beta-L-arabinofuranosidase domain-containing protein [Paludibacter sp.]